MSNPGEAPAETAADPEVVSTASTKSIMERCCREFGVFREAKPLAIGIHKAMIERISDVSGRRLRTVLSVHTNASRYLKAIAHGTVRYDLDGNVCGEVTEAQKQLAVQELKARTRKATARYKEEEAAKIHQQKLQGLADRFNSR